MENGLLVDVANTFRQQEILLTGANGFLGKIILGLLIDRYPNFKHLHVLIRPKVDGSARERFEQEVLRSKPLVDLVKNFGSEHLAKRTTVWEGDAAEVLCGFKGSDIASLRDRIGLVIHCAGLVDFFAPLDQALRANVYSVQQVAALTKQLDAKLVHISTCYVAGCADGLVEETEPVTGFYPRRQGLSDVRFQHARELDECRCQVEKVLHSEEGECGSEGSTRKKDQLVELGRRRAEQWGWANTYTYTKSIGEQVLWSVPDLEFTIVRPAIVESALSFPFAGWVEGGRTAAPLVLMALGGLKDWPIQRNIPLEVVPVDQVAAAILVAGALLLNSEHESVYQLATADTNPLWLGDLVELLVDEAQGISENSSLFPRWLAPVSRLRFLSAEQADQRRQQLMRRLRRLDKLVAFFQQKLVNFKASPSPTLTQWRTQLRTLELQIKFREQVIQQYMPFIYSYSYVFEARRIIDGYEKISTTDRDLLCWSPGSIDWDLYWRKNQIGGIKEWVEPEVVREWSFRI